MKTEIPSLILWFIDLLQLNLTDMGFKNPIEHSIERQLNDPNSEIRQNIN